MAIQSTFIREILRDEGGRFKSNQGRALRKELKFHTYHLLHNRTTEVLNQPNDGGTLRISVPDYNRFLDIKRERRNKRGTGTTRRSRRIYNRFVMGTYYSIAFRVANDFTEEVRRDIRLRFKGGLRNG